MFASFRQDFDKAPALGIGRASVSYAILFIPVNMHFFPANGAERPVFYPFVRAIGYKLSATDEADKPLFTSRRFPVFVDGL